MQIDFKPSNENAFGVAMLAGRVVGTVQGSDGHITVRATCKAKSDGGRWNTVPFEKATHVFFDVPSADGTFADKIGTYYPEASDMKWAGHFFEDRNQTDSRRLAAAKYLMRTASGEIEGAHILKSERCARCSKELTHPDSIFAMFGPECIKKVSAYMPNRSGTIEGAHAPKVADHTPEDVTPTTPFEQFLRTFSDDEIDRIIAKNVARTKKPGDADDRRASLAIVERTRRNVERDQADGTAPREFVPPKPSAQRVEKPAIPVDDKLIARLRAGDDPKVILKALDS